jgi:hypothetical protein
MLNQVSVAGEVFQILRVYENKLKSGRGEPTKKVSSLVLEEELTNPCSKKTT